VQYRTQLDLLAVPVWRGQPLYSAYVIVEASRAAEGFDDLAGDIHALSDPDSNSGYLVTRGLLADKGTSPEAFFRRSFYTYGHRNGIWVAARCEEQDVTSRRTRPVSPVARLHGTEIPKATFTPWTPRQNGRRCPTARVCYAWEDLEKN
jgi:hypothetical protein